MQLFPFINPALRVSVSPRSQCFNGRSVAARRAAVNPRRQPPSTLHRPPDPPRIYTPTRWRAPPTRFQCLRASVRPSVRKLRPHLSTHLQDLLQSREAAGSSAELQLGSSGASSFFWKRDFYSNVFKKFQQNETWTKFPPTNQRRFVFRPF